MSVTVKLHTLYGNQMKQAMIVIGHSYEWRNNKTGEGIKDIQHKLFNPYQHFFPEQQRHIIQQQ